MREKAVWGLWAVFVRAVNARVRRDGEELMPARLQ
jgi:hypothetical protein